MRAQICSPAIADVTMLDRFSSDSDDPKLKEPSPGPSDRPLEYLRDMLTRYIVIEPTHTLLRHGSVVVCEYVRFLAALGGYGYATFTDSRALPLKLRQAFEADAEQLNKKLVSHLEKCTGYIGAGSGLGHMKISYHWYVTAWACTASTRCAVNVLWMAHGLGMSARLSVAPNG